jgi:hypothetical protein
MSCMRVAGWNSRSRNEARRTTGQQSGVRPASARKRTRQSPSSVRPSSVMTHVAATAPGVESVGGALVAESPVWPESAAAAVLACEHLHTTTPAPIVTEPRAGHQTGRSTPLGATTHLRRVVRHP